MSEVRKLQAGDEDHVLSFLRSHVDSSMFLLSNVTAAGIGRPEVRFGGDYWAAFDGRIVGVLGHFWNANMIVQAPNAAARLALYAEVRKAATRPVAGLLGPDEQVIDGVRCLGLADAAFAVDHREQLFSLPAEALEIPGHDPSRVSISHWKDDDPALMQRWLGAYNVAALGADPGPDLDKEMASAVAMAAGFERWVLRIDGRTVALAGFNARVGDLVQVGPVWTPPEYRGRGYARLLLALILKQAFAAGVTRSVLFTSNPAGESAYRVIGFRPSGDYRLAMLKAPVTLA